MTPLMAACAGAWGVGLLVLAGVYAVTTVGTSGGPNHGEHPMIVTIVHTVVFSVASRGWPRPLFWTYFAVLAAALLLSFFVVPLRGDWKDRGVRAARLGMAALYLGMLGVLLFGSR